MVRSDLPFVVAEHQASPRHGLYARLGPRFLRRYYAVYRRSGGEVALLAERDGRPVGFPDRRRRSRRSPDRLETRGAGVDGRREHRPSAVTHDLVEERRAGRASQMKEQVTRDGSDRSRRR